MKEQFLTGFDGNKIFCRIWSEVKSPKAVVQIIHGMVEHSERYDEFAKFLNSKGFIVFGWDLRAHGRTAGSPEQVGKYQGDLFEDCVNDAIFFAEMLIKENNMPLIFLGHSYGSFVLQEVIQQYHGHSLAVFTGSANMRGDSSVGLGLMVARLTKLFKGKDAPAKTIYNLSFVKYGKKFPNGNWLSNDDEIWTKYVADQYCGAVCSANFYLSMFKHLKKLGKAKNLAQVDLDKPILISSGSDDPVGGAGLKLARSLHRQYLELGVSKVEFKVWEKGRHEILNEKNKKEVWAFIVDFCNKNLPKKISRKLLAK